MSFCNEFDLHDFFFFFFVQLLVFIAVTAFNKRGPHGRLVFTKCVLPSVNKVYYYFLFLINLHIVSGNTFLEKQVIVSTLLYWFR